VKQRIQSRHGHLSNAAAAAVLEEIIPAGQIRRVVLGHLSRDCNTPDLASGAIEALLERCGVRETEVYCASQSQISPRFKVGETPTGSFQPTFGDLFFSAAVA
jgi:hypothetical protein